MLKVQYKIVEWVLVLDFVWELDSINVTQNFETIKNIINEHPDNEVIFDFHGVSFINSTAIGQIMDVHSTLLEKEKRLHICNLYKPVEQTLMFVWAFTFLKKYSTQENAIQSILNPEINLEDEVSLDDLFK
jgi:anti-anti-sigma factor